MKIKISKRYLKLPISKNVIRKNILFYRDGDLVFDLTARLDMIDPEGYYYYDMRNWLGCELDIVTEPEISYIPMLSDDDFIEGIYSEKFRPITHFSPKMGWLNDPNGAVYYEGKYHLFFQHNPVGADWANMHWGHAVSEDLIHWEEKEIALFPDEMGMRHSGSAIVDYKNVTGLKENEHDVLILFYTASGNRTRLSQGQPFTQCIAYSTDGGETFKRYKNNPILPHIDASNRDPKVAYVEDGDYYLMALFIKDNKYGFFKSDNLLDWTFTQEVVMPDDQECPDLYPITADNGKKYWIFSGARDHYLVGNINEGRFDAIQDVQSISDAGKSYATQSFFGVPDGRVVRIAWNKSGIPDSRFCGSMCIPWEMSLAEKDGLLKLAATPVTGINDIVSNVKVNTFNVTDEAPVFIDFEGRSVDISVSAEASENAVFKLNILGYGTSVNIADATVTFGNEVCPLECKGGRVDIRFIIDTNSVEVFYNGNYSVAVMRHFADYNVSSLEVRAVCGSVKGKATVKKLKNIWFDK